MLANRLTDGIPVSDNEVKDTRGEANLAHHISDYESSQGSQFGGLHHDGVSGSESGADLPAHHQNCGHKHVRRRIPWREQSQKERTREVPRDDLTNDTIWLIECVDELVFVGLDGLTVDLIGPASIVPDGVNGERDIHILSPLEGLAYKHNVSANPEVVSGGLN